MPHIAFYISALRKGGAERVMVNLIEYFKGRGYRVSLVTQYSAECEYEIDKDIERIYSDITSEEETDSRIINFIKRYRKLQGIWKNLQPDVILSFIGLNNIMTILTTRRLHIPVAVAVRGDPKEEYAGKKLYTLAQKYFPKANLVILQTEDSKDFFNKSVNMKTVVLRNPLSKALLEISPIKSDAREKRIVTAGRLDSNKNQAGIIKAFAGCVEKHPEYSLSIYGDGEDRTKLEQLAIDLGIAEKVEFTGNVPDVWERMKNAQIFVLNSYTEGMPNALLEAMSLGLACISTDCPCGGPKQIIKDGENGLLIPTGDDDKLFEKLSALLDKQEMIREIGEKSLVIREEYSPEKVLSEWEEKLISTCR